MTNDDNFVTIAGQVFSLEGEKSDVITLNDLVKIVQSHLNRETKYPLPTNEKDEIEKSIFRYLWFSGYVGRETYIKELGISSWKEKTQSAIRLPLEFEDVNLVLLDSATASFQMIIEEWNINSQVAEILDVKCPHKIAKAINPGLFEEWEDFLSESFDVIDSYGTHPTLSARKLDKDDTVDVPDDIHVEGIPPPHIEIVNGEKYVSAQDVKNLYIRYSLSAGLEPTHVLSEERVLRRFPSYKVALNTISKVEDFKVVILNKWQNEQGIVAKIKYYYDDFLKEIKSIPNVIKSDSLGFLSGVASGSIEEISQEVTKHVNNWGRLGIAYGGTIGSGVSTGLSSSTGLISVVPPLQISYILPCGLLLSSIVGVSLYYKYRMNKNLNAATVSNEKGLLFLESVLRLNAKELKKVTKKANQFYLDNEDNNCFHYACRRCDVDIHKVLYEKFFGYMLKGNDFLKNKKGETPLFHAVIHDCRKLFSLYAGLSITNKEELDHTDNDGNNIWDIIAGQKYPKSTLNNLKNILVEKNLWGNHRLNRARVAGEDFTMFTLRYGFYDRSWLNSAGSNVVKKILYYGRSELENTKNSLVFSDDLYILYSALLNDHFEVFENYERVKFDYSLTLLHVLATNPTDKVFTDQRVISYLYKIADVPDMFGRNALHILCETCQDTEICKRETVKFLKYGVSPDDKDDEGNSVYHSALINNKFEVFKLLPVAPPQQLVNDKGRTPLYYVNTVEEINKSLDKGFEADSGLDNDGISLLNHLYQKSLDDVCNVLKDRKSEIFAKLESTRDESGLMPKESKEIFGNPIADDDTCKIRDDPSDIVNSISDAKAFIETHKEINEKDKEVITTNIKKVEEELPTVFDNAKTAEEIKTELENVKEKLDALPEKKTEEAKTEPENVKEKLDAQPEKKAEEKSIRKKLEGKYNMRIKDIDFWLDN